VPQNGTNETKPNPNPNTNPNRNTTDLTKPYHQKYAANICP